MRAALLSYFELDDLRRLLDALEGAGMPSGAQVHIGTYGVSGTTGDLVRAAGWSYSPLFKTDRTEVWEHRRLTPEEERRVGTRLAGRVPSIPALLRLSGTQRRAWGIEVGRRYHDSIRAAVRNGVRIPSWQLDELGTQLAGSQGRGHRQLVRGILQGLALGRPQLNDPERKGFVWATRAALRLASRTADAELRAFWSALDRAAFRVVGEEYPEFVGDPRRAASVWADGQRALARGDQIRQGLARRYVAGMTPGYVIVPGLGGNVAGLSQAQVNRWRDAYIAERARTGAAGFGEYNFRFGNSRTPVLRDVTRAVARGMALLG